MISKALGNLLYISRTCNSYRRQAAGDKDLKASHQMIISFVIRHPGMSQEQIGGKTGVEKTMMTRILKCLEDNEYIYREVSEKDARCRLVYPTEKAKEVYPEIHQIFEDVTDMLLDGLTQEEIDQLSELTSKVRENAKRIFEEEILS